MANETTGNSIQDMINSAAQAVGQNASQGGTTDGTTAQAPSGVTIERHSARTIEGRAKSGN